MPGVLKARVIDFGQCIAGPITRNHEGFGPITTTAPGVKLSRTPVTVGRPASRPGSDVAGVLAEIGLGGELDRLIRERVIAVEGVKAGC